MADSELLRTPLHAWHQAHGARLVEFGGWSMPVQYTSIIEEHEAVRNRVGLFDISHMGRLTFHGPGTLSWIERRTTNQAAKLADGQIQYSLMVNEQGGILDDILVYRSEFGYSIVCNASNREKVVAQFQSHGHLRDGDAVLTDRTLDTAMIAVQGPRAIEVLRPLFDGSLEALKYYHSTMGLVDGLEAIVSRTGYTGEDGFEVVVNADGAEGLWNSLMEAGRDHGIRAIGLGARDTLRFEAAMPLYGHELLESINPYEAGIGWAVKLKKGDFVGRDALRTQKNAPARQRVGLALEGKRIARQDYPVLHEGTPVGSVTSGTFAPTFQRSLAMALVAPRAAAPGTILHVDLRGQAIPAEVVPLPFYRRDPHPTSALPKTT